MSKYVKLNELESIQAYSYLGGTPLEEEDMPGFLYEKQKEDKPIEEGEDEGD